MSLGHCVCSVFLLFRFACVFEFDVETNVSKELKELTTLRNMENLVSIYTFCLFSWR